MPKIIIYKAHSSVYYKNTLVALLKVQKIMLDVKKGQGKKKTKNEKAGKGI